MLGSDYLVADEQWPIRGILGQRVMTTFAAQLRFGIGFAHTVLVKQPESDLVPLCQSLLYWVQTTQCREELKMMVFDREPVITPCGSLTREQFDTFLKTRMDILVVENPSTGDDSRV